MILGICTPYRRCEVTAAALTLAGMALTRSATVRILSTGPVERGVHPYWDKKVHAPGGNAAYHWAKGCDYLLWFDHQPKLVQQSRLVAETKRHALVLSWHGLPRTIAHEAVHALHIYDRIVCPTRVCYKAAVEYVFGDVDPRVACCPWATGFAPVTRGGVIEPGQLRLYVPLDGATMDETGLFTIRAVNEALSMFPHLHVTMDCDKSWPRKIRGELKEFVEVWEDRLMVGYRTNLVDQVTQLHCHDLVYLPSIRANFGQMALTSLACHVPVIAYDVEPFSSIVKNGVQGALASCDVSPAWTGAPIAEPKLMSLLDIFRASLGDEGFLTRSRGKAWNLHKREQDFNSFWEREWQLSS